MKLGEGKINNSTTIVKRGRYFILYEHQSWWRLENIDLPRSADTTKLVVDGSSILLRRVFINTGAVSKDKPERSVTKAAVKKEMHNDKSARLNRGTMIEERFARHPTSRLR